MGIETTGMQGAGAVTTSAYPALLAECVQTDTPSAPSAASPSAPPEDAKLSPSPICPDETNVQRGYLAWVATWVYYKVWSTKPEVDDPAKKINDLQLEVARLKELETQLQTENGQMKQGISDWSQAFEAQKQASSSQQADLTQRITGLSQKIAEQTQKTTVLEKDKERLAVEKNALSEALTKTKSELEEIKKGKQIVSQGIEKATIDTLRKQVAALSKKVETKDAEITGLQKENRARIAERDELSCQVANWNTSYAKIEEAQKKIFEWIEKRDAGIAELKILMTEVVANKQAQSRPGGG